MSKGGSSTIPKHNTITGNTVKNSTSFGIQLDFAERCLVSGNTVENATGTSINLTNGSAAAHNHVQGNTLILRVTAGNGISVTGDYVTVTGNHIDHSQVPGGQGVAYGTGADFGLITGNQIAGCTTGIALSGTHCLVDGNQTFGTTSNAVVEGAAGDYNIIASHYMSLTTGGSVVLVGANSRAAGPFYNRGLNRVETRTNRLGVGNSLAATTPGAVVRKIEVYDAAGVSLGFVPVYIA